MGTQNGTADTNDGTARRDAELRRTSFWLMMALLGGLALIALRFLLPYLISGFARKAWDATGIALVCMLWGLAWFSASFVMGFLFGVPRTQARSRNDSQANANGASGQPSSDEAANTGAGHRLQVNTNLEEISDWLTKILVGATLTQLGQVPQMVQRSAAYMAKGLGGGAHESMAGAMVVYFSALGFFAGYVLTRMFFSGAFGRSDRDSGLPTPGDVAKMRAVAVTSETVPPMDNEAQKTAERMRNVPITDRLTATQAVAVARGALVTEDNDRAVVAAKLAANKDPTNAEAQITYAYALHRAGAPSRTIIEQLLRAHAAIRSGGRVDSKEDLYNSLVYIALYHPPEGYPLAIAWGNEFLAEQQPRRASLWINLACAQAQAYKHARDPQEKKAAMEETKRFVEAAIKREKLAVDRLRQLADPKDSDGDLADVARDSPEIRALLAP